MHDNIDSFILHTKGREQYLKLALKDIKELGLNPTIYYDFENRYELRLLNRIMNCAKKYFLWLDDDDRYPNLGALEELYKLMETSNVPFAYSSEIEIREDGTFTDKVNYIEYDIEKHKRSAITVHGLILIRRSMLTDEFLKRIPLNTKYFIKSILLELVKKHGNPLSTNIIGRYWRRHNKQHSNKY